MHSFCWCMVHVVCCCLNSDRLSVLSRDLLALLLCCCDSAMKTAVVVKTIHILFLKRAVAQGDLYWLSIVIGFTHLPNSQPQCPLQQHRMECGPRDCLRLRKGQYTAKSELFRSRRARRTPAIPTTAEFYDLGKLDHSSDHCGAVGLLPLWRFKKDAFFFCGYVLKWLLSVFSNVVSSL